MAEATTRRVTLAPGAPGPRAKCAAPAAPATLGDECGRWKSVGRAQVFWGAAIARNIPPWWPTHLCLGRRAPGGRAARLLFEAAIVDAGRMLFPFVLPNAGLQVRAAASAGYPSRARTHAPPAGPCARAATPHFRPPAPRMWPFAMPTQRRARRGRQGRTAAPRRAPPRSLTHHPPSVPPTLPATRRPCARSGSTTALCSTTGLRTSSTCSTASACPPRRAGACARAPRSPPAPLVAPHRAPPCPPTPPTPRRPLHRFGRFFLGVMFVKAFQKGARGRECAGRRGGLGLPQCTQRGVAPAGCRAA